MACILSIETSTNVCSVAVHENDRLLATTEVHIEQSHATKLAVLIDEVIKISGKQNNQLDAVAVASGPGSYTGLRIGVSTAKGLCFGLDIPLIAIGTLELLTFQVSRLGHQDCLLCPMIDARRMEVYCLIANADLKTLESVEAKIIDELSFIDILEEHEIFFFGNGAEKCIPVIRHVNAHFINGIYPKASDLGIMAMPRLIENKVEDLSGFEPQYVKGFVAKKARTLI